MEVDVILGAYEYSLTDGVYCYYLGDDGLGMVPIHRLTERGPLQHGETDRGFRADPRFFRLFLDIQGESWENLFTRRHNLMELFRPTDDPVIVRWTFDTFTRQIDAFFDGDMGMPSSARNAFAQNVAVGLRAPDPTFYDPDQSATVFQVGGGPGSGFVVPMPVSVAVGQSVIDADKTIDNDGSFLAYPQITIEGPIVNPVINNYTTGEKLDFTGYTLGSSQYLLIDCRYGYKTVKREDDTNELDELSTDSDLATFHLIVGENDFNVSGTGADGNTEVYINFYKRYIGI